MLLELRFLDLRLVRRFVRFFDFFEDFLDPRRFDFLDDLRLDFLERRRRRVGSEPYTNTGATGR